MKVYHYTHPSKCREILRGESPGLNPVSFVGRLNDKELYGSFGLLEPRPDNWVNNTYFPDFWDVLKLHMGQILLEVDVYSKSNGVIVVDRGHMAKFNSSLHGLEITYAVPVRYAHDTLEQATEAYIRSGIPISEFLQKSGNPEYALPEVVITEPISSKRILVSQTQPLLEDELQTGGLQIGDEPLVDRPIEERTRNAGFYVRSIPELQGWFERYIPRMESEPAPK